jgi:hypothetical protein
MVDDGSAKLSRGAESEAKPHIRKERSQEGRKSFYDERVSK